MSGIYSRYFSENGFDFNTSINKLCSHIHSKYFDHGEVIQLTLNVPDNKTYTHTLLSYDGYHVQYLYTGIPTRIGLTTDSIQPNVISLTEAQTALYTPVSDFKYCLFGNYILLKNTETPRSITIKARVIKKSYDTLYKNIYDRLEELYYGLQTRDIDLVYQSLRRLSDSKNDTVLSVKRVKPNHRVKPFRINRSLRT